METIWQLYFSFLGKASRYGMEGLQCQLKSQFVDGQHSLKLEGVSSNVSSFLLQHSLNSTNWCIADTTGRKHGFD